MNCWCASRRKDKHSRHKSKPDSRINQSEPSTMPSLYYKHESIYSERTNHIASTLTKANEFQEDEYHSERDHNGQGNEDSANVEKIRSAVEGMKQHYVDKIFKLQLERSDLKTAFARTSKENQDMKTAFEKTTKENHDIKRWIEIRNAQHEDDIRYVSEFYKAKLENYERDVEKYKRDLVKKDRAHDVMSYQLNDAWHKLDTMKKDSYDKTKAFKREIEQLEKENCDLIKTVENEIYNSKQAFDETLKRQLDSTGKELECCVTKMNKLVECEQAIRNENEGLRSQLVETERTLQHSKQKTTEYVRALEYEKSHTVTNFNDEDQTYIEIRIHQLSTENENLKRNIIQQRTTFDQQLKEATESNNDLQRLKSCEIELENANAKLHQCQKDIHSVREMNANNKTKSESKISKLQQIAHEFETSKAHLQKENSELNADIIQLRQENDHLKRQENDYLRRHSVEDYNALQNKLHHTEKILKQTELELETMTTRLQKDALSSKTLHDSKIANLLQEKRGLEGCQADLEKKNDQMTIDITTLQKRLESDQIRRPTFADYGAMQQNLCHKENELKQTEQELEDTNTRLHECQRDLQSVRETRGKYKTQSESKIAKLQQIAHEFETSKAHLQKENSELNADIIQLRQENDHLKRQENDYLRRHSVEDYNALQNKLHHTEKILKQTELELESMTARLQRDTLSSKTLHDSKIANLLQEKRGLEACNADLEKKNDQMTIDIKALQKRLESDQIRRPTFEDYDAMQQKLHHKEKELKQTEQELEDTKTRLSKCMGDKLTNNNPNIVDLSDMNRPSKLADRYKELYDNQWTDAYEILEDTETEEERIIYILLAILEETKRFCDEENRIQMEETLKAITHSDKVQIADIPVGVIKYIKDCRKSSSAQDIKIKYEKYKSEMRKGSFSLAKQALTINEYLNECFEICWLMSIQDPPVVLSPLLKHGVSFRADLYCAYTVSGELVDYIVWPALLLHENGPTLTKGVAQGMKRA